MLCCLSTFSLRDLLSTPSPTTDLNTSAKAGRPHTDKQRQGDERETGRRERDREREGKERKEKEREKDKGERRGVCVPLLWTEMTHGHHHGGHHHGGGHHNHHNHHNHHHHGHNHGYRPIGVVVEVSVPQKKMNRRKGFVSLIAFLVRFFFTSFFL